MRRFIVHGAPLLALLLLAGCRRAAPVAPESQVRLGDAIDINVAAWLSLPRHEQARHVEEWTVTVGKQLEHARAHPESAELLPQLHPPATMPVFQEARFSTALKVSVPPYLKDGQHDPAVALHLARFGDREGAQRLAPPDDAALRARLQGQRGPNFPVEWVRLVALAQRSAELKLAAGEPIGAAELVGIHRQLLALFKEKEAPAALRAALLPAGRRALALSAHAYRGPKKNMTALAADIDAALLDWGDSPAPAPGLAPGAGRADVSAVLGAPARGRAVVCLAPADLPRALDLLALPVAHEAVVSVTGFLDETGHLSELLLVYRDKVESLYPEPGHLAYPLLNGSAQSKGPVNVPGLLRQAYESDGLRYEVARVTRASPVGAYASVRSVKAPPPFLGDDARALGPVHLDRSFEANRVAVAPERAGPQVSVTRQARLAALVGDLGTLLPARAVLRREPAHDLVAALALTWSADHIPDVPGRLLPPLWQAYGPPRVDGYEDDTSAGLVFLWEGPRTRARLRLPFGEKAPDMTIEDARGSAAVKERAEAARQKDLGERAERLAEKRPLVRLRRGPVELNGRDVEALALGAPRARAEAALPRGSKARRRDLDDGLRVTVVPDPTLDLPFRAREVFLRFRDERVVEVRARYDEVAEGKRGLLARLEALPQGRGESVAPDWAGLWGDVAAARQRPVKYRWQDDLTVLTYQSDGGVAEVVWRERPADRPDGLELPPMLWVGTGPEGCRLGTDREAVVAALGAGTKTDEGAEAHRLPASGPYEYALVWYEAGKVARVVAVERERPGTTPFRVTAALRKSWARDVRELGLVRRVIGRDGGVLERFVWHDDRVRVQAFVQDADQGTRLLREWRTWPVPGARR
jgi:hypothetical protein